MEKVRRLIT